MASPFPGMDPYLEARGVWPGFHHSLAEEIKTQLNRQIGPKYFADVEVHAVMEGIDVAARRAMYPDAAVLEQRSEPLGEPPSTAGTVVISKAPLQRQVVLPEQIKLRSVRIYVTETAELVTTIEILSPVNKQRGEGIDAYRRKRHRILASAVHLVELDLLRGGERPGEEVAYPPLSTEYVLVVNRANGEEVRLSDIWPVPLSDPLPVLPVPLIAPDPDAALDLGEALTTLYERGGYAWRIDYTLPVPPPQLRPEMATWVAAQLGEQRS